MTEKSGPDRVKVPKTALKLARFSVYFSAKYKSIQIPIEQNLFEEIGEIL